MYIFKILLWFHIDAESKLNISAMNEAVVSSLTIVVLHETKGHFYKHLIEANVSESRLTHTRGNLVGVQVQFSFSTC